MTAEEIVREIGCDRAKAMFVRAALLYLYPVTPAEAAIIELERADVKGWQFYGDDEGGNQRINALGRPMWVNEKYMLLGDGRTTVGIEDRPDLYRRGLVALHRVKGSRPEWRDGIYRSTAVSA